MAIKFFNDPSKLWNLTELLLQGAGVTLSIFFLTLLFAVPLGVLFAQARMSKHAVLRAPNVPVYLPDAQHPADAANHVRLLSAAADPAI